MRQLAIERFVCFRPPRYRLIAGPGNDLTITPLVRPPDAQVVESVQSEPLGGGVTTFRVTFREGLEIALSLDPRNPQPARVQSEEFNFHVSQGGPLTSFQNLSMDPAHPRYFANILNAGTGLVRSTGRAAAA